MQYACDSIYHTCSFFGEMVTESEFILFFFFVFCCCCFSAMMFLLILFFSFTYCLWIFLKSWSNRINEFRFRWEMQSVVANIDFFSLSLNCETVTIRCFFKVQRHFTAFDINRHTMEHKLNYIEIYLVSLLKTMEIIIIFVCCDQFVCPLSMCVIFL